MLVAEPFARSLSMATSIRRPMRPEDNGGFRHSFLLPVLSHRRNDGPLMAAIAVSIHSHRRNDGRSWRRLRYLSTPKRRKLARMDGRSLDGRPDQPRHR